jgi:uncharacterized membrane protein HdeD (DUF308 family)
LSSRLHKIAFLVIGIVSLILGVVLVGTAGIRGFNGTGGEDTLLFQLVTYVMVPPIIGGLLAIATAFRPNRLLVLLSGVLLILPGLFLTLINPVFGLPMIVFGVAALVMRSKIPKN